MMFLKYLVSIGKVVVVGGFDFFVVFEVYFQNGVVVVVKDKFGVVNWLLFNYLLGKGLKEVLIGVVLVDGIEYWR